MKKTDTARIFKGKAVTFVSLALVILAFLALSATLIISAVESADTEDGRVILEGKYSIDGGEWQDTLPDKMTDKPFHTLKVKGRISQFVFQEQVLTVFADNVWYTLESPNLILGTNYRFDDSSALKNSPGCTIQYVNAYGIGVNEELTLTLVYPYSLYSDKNLTDFFQMYVTDYSGVYELMLEKHIVTALLCLVICFFGLLAFPIAGTVLGGINVRYLAFSVLCFFTGIHLLAQMLYPYLPLWIPSEVLCMTLGESTSHIFGICALLFLTVILQHPRHRLIGNIVLGAFTAFIVTLAVLHFTGVRDLYASATYAQIFFVLCSAVMAVCLLREIKTNSDALNAAVTLIPIGLTLLYDTLNTYFGFTSFMLFEYGAALALVFQIVCLLVDLRRQYKETIRYQQLQKELYESRVAIMVSQIQPHFLYNSLTSIAMMCTIDPETAQEATVTFADYLRGNMDSLKQKTPVPFSKELEHLKKYLYIEKLRFGKKLNIVYDIQTEDFVLPQLSIQPLVENAVKHGVGMKKGGGTVTISTLETETAYKVIIADDGVGFDTEQVKNDGRSHIGMDNVRRRLKEMCGADVEIKSIIGTGTMSTVTLPKEGQSNENTVR